MLLQEELEEGAQTTIYDNFKFLTKEDLERLNLTNLIGTNLLRAYMHGFFIDYRLYKKVRLVFHEGCYILFSETKLILVDDVGILFCLFVRNVCIKTV